MAESCVYMYGILRDEQCARPTIDGEWCEKHKPQPLRREREQKQERLGKSLARDIWVVFDGPPSRESGRFIETEDESGKGVSGGWGWNQYEKYWKLGPFADRAEVVKLEVKFAEAGEENQRLRETIGMSEPWPVTSILRCLADAADELLTRHSYDGHGHEEVSHCRDKARDRADAIDAALRAALTEKPDGK